MARKKKDDKVYVEVEGIKCEVKNASKESVSKYYQENLRQVIEDYIIDVDRWSESKRNYRDNLKINVVIAPFTLGWLRKPEDPDEYLVIKGRITMDELKAKRAKEAKKNAPKKRAPRKTAIKKAAPKKAAPKSSKK